MVLMPATEECLESGWTTTVLLVFFFLFIYLFIGWGEGYYLVNWCFFFLAQSTTRDYNWAEGDFHKETYS